MIDREEDEGNVQVSSSCDVIVPNCVVCHLPIRQRYLSKVLDASAHSDCLRCYDCRILLTDSCYARSDRLLCKNDFYRSFGVKCCGCLDLLSPLDVVRMTHDSCFHLSCFQCSLCRRALETGEEFVIMSNRKLVCRTDYELIRLKDEESGNSAKRPRTTITQAQQEALKRVYVDSKKPARHIREELSLETGLDMRVVQVWFQNRRAKEKRLEKDAGKLRSCSALFQWNHLPRTYRHHYHHHYYQFYHL